MSLSVNSASPTAVVRLAHFSDIHVTAHPLGWRLRDWFSKCATGWIHWHCLGRKRRFRHVDQIVSALIADLRQRRYDHIIFSGDATALGFDAEVHRAAELLGLTKAAPLAGLAVPGNHDYYTPAAAVSGAFERYFAPWQTGERLDESIYPFCQKVGPIWLVAVNTSTPHYLPWDARGYIGKESLNRLEQIFHRLSPGPRILVTHYPVCRATGDEERHYHGLIDIHDLIAVATRGGVCLWLHGHQHHVYHLEKSKLSPFPVICAGSATQCGAWSYLEYTITGCKLEAVSRRYEPQSGTFQDCYGFAFDLTIDSSSSPPISKSDL